MTGAGFTGKPHELHQVGCDAEATAFVSGDAGHQRPSQRLITDGHTDP